MSGFAARIRYRPDTGWELRCDDCRDQRFWPIGTGPSDPSARVYWMPERGYRRCRACHKARDARNLRARYLRDTSMLERKRDYQRRYRAATKEAERIKAAAKWAALKADPVAYARDREQGRETSRRYRQRKREAA